MTQLIQKLNNMHILYNINMNKVIIKITIIIVGIICGIIYYLNMKYSIEPKFRNCSFVANKMTDFLAFIVGLILIVKGFIYDDYLLIICGIAIIIEHICQFTYKI